MPVHILIIDSNVGFIVRLKKALEERNYIVRTVGRPGAALAAIHQKQFDLAVIDLKFPQIEQIVTVLRQSQAQIPIILSGQDENDPEKVARYGAQAYINKPYVARDLIPIMDMAQGKIISPVQLFEPPIADDATIGDVLLSLNDPEIEAEIIREAETGGESSQQPLPPDTLPESVPLVTDRKSPALSALRLANNENLMDTLLFQTIQPKIKNLPSWEQPNTPEELAQVENVLRVVETFEEDIEQPPYAAFTQPLTLPEIDLFAEDTTTPSLPSQPINLTLLDALAEAESLDDPRLQAALQELTQQPELIATTVEEITRAMGVVSLDDLVEDTSQEIEVAEVEMSTVANAALQVTQLALESTALGTLLMQATQIIARTGDFKEETWQLIAQEVLSSWHRSGQPHTWMHHLDLDTTVMIYSVKTIDNLILSMIFSSDTSLRVIRRQATILTEALSQVPNQEVVVQSLTPSQEQEIEETPAAKTTPSRPTALRPPEKLKPEREQEKSPRPAGTYTSYSCLWLIDNTAASLDEALIEAMKRWIERSAIANEWDVIEMNVGNQWVNLHVEVPNKDIPNQVIHQLMQETEQQFGAMTKQTAKLWATGYSITTPGRLLAPHEIEHFIRYHSEK